MRDCEEQKESFGVAKVFEQAGLVELRIVQEHHHFLPCSHPLHSFIRLFEELGKVHGEDGVLNELQRDDFPLGNKKQKLQLRVEGLPLHEDVGVLRSPSFPLKVLVHEGGDIEEEELHSLVRESINELRDPKSPLEGVILPQVFTHLLRLVLPAHLLHKPSELWEAHLDSLVRFFDFE